MDDFFDTGLDVLGAGMDAGTFAPWLKVVGGALGGALGSFGGGADTGAATTAAAKAAVEAALEKERQRQAAEKAQAEAAKTRMILYGVIAAAVAGGAVMLFKKK